MKTYKYQNVSNQAQTLLGVGEVEPGGIVELDFALENPNLVPLSAREKKTKQETN